MIARLLLLLCCVFLFGACASKKKDPYYTRSSGRDYYSVNKASVSFLFETFSLERNRRHEGQRQARPDHSRCYREWRDLPPV